MGLGIELIYDTWDYIFAILLALIPPFLIGILIFIFTKKNREEIQQNIGVREDRRQFIQFVNEYSLHFDEIQAYLFDKLEPYIHEMVDVLKGEKEGANKIMDNLQFERLSTRILYEQLKYLKFLKPYFPLTSKLLIDINIIYINKKEEISNALSEKLNQLINEGGVVDFIKRFIKMDYSNTFLHLLLLLTTVSPEFKKRVASELVHLLTNLLFFSIAIYYLTFREMTLIDLISLTEAAFKHRSNYERSSNLLNLTLEYTTELLENNFKKDFSDGWYETLIDLSTLLDKPKIYLDVYTQKR